MALLRTDLHLVYKERNVLPGSTETCDGFASFNMDFYIWVTQVAWPELPLYETCGPSALIYVHENFTSV